MKKLFAILAVMGVLTLGSVQPVMAQDAAPAQTPWKISFCQEVMMLSLPVSTAR